MRNHRDIYADRHPSERGERRHGRGRRGMFDSDELQSLLLSLIAESPRHGYELIAAIEGLTGGAYTPSAGLIYPTLTLLAEMGLIAEQSTDSARRTYAITEAGAAQLADKTELLDQIRARAAELSSRSAREEASPVRRAMENLHSAVRNRVKGREVEEQTLFTIVEILDETARRIERL
ncbi:PadR family transcriptional regulator [Thioclava sp. BHET1]|nr:PadR family transcriptional regulator [Thioclava sp. BHET1]